MGQAQFARLPLVGVSGGRSGKVTKLWSKLTGSRTTARPKALTFIDQALSSATNFGGSALAAGLLTASDFGAFAVAVAVLLLVVGVSRSCCGYVLMLVGPGEGDMVFRRLLSGAVATSLVVGALGSLAAVSVGQVVGGPTGRALLTLAVCVPLVTAQDAYRFAALTRRQPIRACISDGLWLVCMVAGVMYLRVFNIDSVALAVLFANATAVVGLGYAAWAVRAAPSPSALREWVRRTKGMATRLTLEFMLASAASIVPLILVTAWNADLAHAGSLRGAQAMMGPLAVLFAASTLYTQPVMVEMHRQSRDVLNMAKRQSVMNTTASIAWIFAAWLIPARLGVRAFGASWVGLHDILILVGLSFVGLAISSGPLTALRSRGQLNAGLATQATTAAIVLTMTAVGGLLFEEGTLSGFAAGNIAASGVAWFVAAKWAVRDVVARPASSTH